ncbi:hypothetical protein DFH08DRAFT_810681 [Mycena albidolilacea]|uniref:Uncharacterized protein n=1 Tax=Mycena albidolilacea TaxID=1033008 RepID=A0AAD7EPZ2_9AGAR|nr:hypothetical protein DFH08DRAFT_810681 [Mycena albidolilacea]
MDFLFFSSVMGIMLLTIVMSYNILPDWVEVIFKVPKFYLLPHIKKCHGLYSFNYTKGVGQTDGEGVKRNWSWLNLAARSISVMGPGAHEDTIDNLCNSLLRKMVLAIPQATVHSRAFHLFSAGLREGHKEDLEKSEKLVRDREMDNEDSKNLYDYAEVEVTTMADVLAWIAMEEHARVSQDGTSGLVVKLGPFLIAGIEIQESQQLYARIVYLDHSADASVCQPEATQHQRRSQSICHHHYRLASDNWSQEDTLCNAQVDEALSAACYHMAQSVLFSLWGPGSWENKLQVLRQQDISGMNKRALNNEEKEENRKAGVLAGLVEDTDGKDVNAYSDPVELTVLFNLEIGEGCHMLSWIWYTESIKDADVGSDGSLHEDIHIEWTKARTRVDHWRKELILLKEEMRQVLKFCEWKASGWDQRVNCDWDVALALIEGLQAYPLAQAGQERAWERAWHDTWVAIHERAKIVMCNHIVDVMELLPLEVELEGDEQGVKDGYDTFDEEDFE